MKKMVFIAVQLLLTVSIVAQEEWAELGSSWYIRGQHVFGPPYYEAFTVLGDTVVLGKDCRVIERYANYQLITYSEGDSVFLFEENEFNLVFNFSAGAGEGWEFPRIGGDTVTIFVDSVSMVDINGIELQAQHVSYFDTLGQFLGMDRIYRNIGSHYTLLPMSFRHLEGGLNKLCSFSSPSLGELVFDEINCSFSNETEVKGVGLPFLIIHPNPTADYLNFQLRGPGSAGRDASFRITGAQGRTVREFAVGGKNETYIVPVWDWGSGVYFLQYVEDGEVRVTERFVVSR